jgi:hypothetical protein
VSFARHRDHRAIEQVHVRPWSTVFRLPTNNGAVYLKCCGPTQAHEPRLTALLHREFPRLVTEVLALVDILMISLDA